MTLHLDEVADKGAKTCWWENFTEECNESKLSNQVHVFTYDISLDVVQSGIFKCLIAPDTLLVVSFTLNFFYRSQTVGLIHFNRFFELIIQFIHFWFHVNNGSNILLGYTPILGNTLSCQKHDENRFVEPLNESNRNHGSVVVEEVKQKHFHDEGVIVVLLVLVVFIVCYLLSELHIALAELDDQHLIEECNALT